MKRVFVIFIVGLLMLPMINGCKKGENDPPISFKTRDSRITAEWVLKSGSVVTTSTAGQKSSTTTATFDGVERTVSEEGKTDTVTPYKEEITFRRDGKFTIEEKINGVYSTYSGSWYFANKSVSLKQKNAETVVLVITEKTVLTSEYSYSGTDCTVLTFKIDRLSSKELILTQDASNSLNTTSTVTQETTAISTITKEGTKSYKAKF